MALQQFVFGFVVLIICTFKGGHASLVCGTVEGHDDSPENWPWQVSITQEGCYICGGSLINDQWILTSAQYFQSMPDANFSSVVVHLGSTVSSSFSDSSVTREVVDKTCYHSNNDYYYYSHTICLLKLSAPVSFGPNIQPVCLAARGSTFHSGDSGLVAGWSTEYYGYFKQHTYKDVSVSVLGPNECRCRFYMMSNSTLCVETTDYTYVQTASFPLMVKQDSVWVQAGIINDYCSNSYPCLSPKLSDYQDWITEVTGGNNQTGFVYVSSPGEDSDMDFNCTTPTYPTYYEEHRGNIFDSSDKIIPHFGQLLSLCGLTLLLFVMG